MAELNSPIQIRNYKVKNRIVLPPLVVCTMHPDGKVGDAVLDHYESFARGGAGIIVQEATCVLPEGKLAGPQIGLWEDAQIEEGKRIVGRCKPYDTMMLVQIHYASKQGEPDDVVQISPSEYTNHDGPHRALSTAEVERIRDGFVAAAVRAEKAGYDGVELHGAHGYLINAFMHSKINRRDDRYGDTLQLVREIAEGIRQSTGKDFVLTIRMGVDNPDVATGVAQSKVLETMGFDLLNVSHGMMPDAPRTAPEGYPYSPLSWLGALIKTQVSLPVIAVGGLDKPGVAAQFLAENRADFVAVGRGFLVDPEWGNKAMRGEAAFKCYDCKRCVWFADHTKCPGRKKAVSAK